MPGHTADERRRPGLPGKASATAAAAVARRRKRRTAPTRAGTNPFAGLARRR